MCGSCVPDSFRCLLHKKEESGRSSSEFISSAAQRPDGTVKQEMDDREIDLFDLINFTFSKFQHRRS